MHILNLLPALKDEAAALGVEVIAIDAENVAAKQMSIVEDFIAKGILARRRYEEPPAFQEQHVGRIQCRLGVDVQGKDAGFCSSALGCRFAHGRSVAKART